MMSDEDRAQAAATLWRAFEDKVQAPPLSATYPDMDIIDAYRIQERFAAARTAEGHEVTGYKIGLTSKAMQEMAGVDEPDYGVLLDFLMAESGATLASSEFIRPAVEIELAFVMKDELRGPGVTADEVVAATDYVVPAIEIVDFRLAFKGRRGGILDTVADLASCGKVVVGGNRCALDKIDPAAVTGRLLKNGEEAETGAAAAVLDNPVNAIVWLANKLGEVSDVTFQPGHTILSGSFIRIVRAEAGDRFVAEFDSDLGSVEVRIE